MKSNYRKLGEFIRQVDVRNVDGKEENLLGVSVQKVFIPSIANTVGTDFTKYKVVKKGQFTYIPDTSRRGDKIGIALLEDFEEGLVSNVYTVFEIIDEEQLLSKYLMLWFSRSEFDRYARFKSHGSVREVMDWEEMCNVELPVPNIDVQRKIVAAYKIVEDRIELKRRINDNLEATAQAVFEDYFAEYYAGASFLPNGWKKAMFSDVCQIRGGKRLPAECEFANDITTHPYVRIRDMYQGKYLELTEDFEYIGEDVFAYIRNYTVASGDVIIAIVGITSGEIAIIGETLDGANLTENCVKLTNYNGITAEYLYCYWQYLRKNGGIDPLLVGAAQPKLPMYNIQAVPVIIPDDTTMDNYQKRVAKLAKGIHNNIQEIRSLREMRQFMVSRLSSF